jgi:glycosyl-4,4'-diaponeurosporenoate acyltransferase
MAVSLIHQDLRYVLYDVLFWIGANFIIGFVLSSIDNRRFGRFVPSAPANELSRRAVTIKKFTKVDKWKRYLPEAGAFFKGGINKASLGPNTTNRLETMMNEFQRARVVHLLLIFVWPITLAFNPLWITLAMAPYVLIANVPCLISLTYSYYRFGAVLKRR